MNWVLFASKLALKALIIVYLGVATLVLNLNSEAEPLTGQNQNTVPIGLDHDESAKPQTQSKPDQADTVAEPHMHDDQRCKVMCLLPAAAADKE